LIYGCFAASRAIHFVACLLIFCVCVFDRFLVRGQRDDLPPSLREHWRILARRLMLFALALALISGVCWFYLVVLNMSDVPISQLLRSEAPGAVWNQTFFGWLWKVRLGLWCAIALTIPLSFGWTRDPRLRGYASFSTLVLSIPLAGSLAWAGHGTVGHSPSLHLAADVIHILVTGLWPIGLLPLILLLRAVFHRRELADHAVVARHVARFSALSLASVIVLTITGLINGWILIGPPANLWRSSYGRLLVLKVLAFLFMVLLGAFNLRIHKPKLAQVTTHNHAAQSLRLNVTMELVLGGLVMILVGILGQLPPGFERP
jgi:putative copper resistance protein D